MLVSANDTASREAAVRRATALAVSVTSLERSESASAREEVRSALRLSSPSDLATVSMLSVISASEAVVSRANDSSCATRF